MRIFKFFMCLVFFVTALWSAQNEEATLENICYNTLKTETLEALPFVKNGQGYLVLNSKERNSKSEIHV